MKLLIVNIGELVGIVPEGVLRKQGAEMSETGILKDAWISIEDGLIKNFGPMSECPETGSDVLDADGGMVMPAFCDSHTHVVYAGSREGEFLDKINGLSYEEIAARGGGILNSSDLLHRTSEDDLFSQSMERVREVMAAGTGAIEIKSGYGLNPEDEMKMLRVIRRIRQSVPAVVRATFLGAHAVGRGCTHDEYVDTVVGMMPQAAELSDFVDVFCDEGFFTPEDTGSILKAGAACGLPAKIHANELAESGGVEVGVRYGALSVDHLERSGPAQIETLKGTSTMFRNGTRLHPDAPYSRPGLQCGHAQQRLCHGGSASRRLHYPRQDCQSDRHSAWLEPHPSRLPLPHPVHPHRPPPRTPNPRLAFA